MKTVLHYGGGTNSAAMVAGLVELDERPDLILFADTMAEKPHTYTHLDLMDLFLASHGFPEITRVRFKTRDGVELTLEQDCLNRKALPGIAYGFKSCSERFKLRPQNAFVKQWAKGEPVTKLIGFDAGEERRAKPYPDVRYPLIEWGWDRDDCIVAIKRVGLPLPGKSACFYCPSSKKAEVLELAQQYPELYARALAMEANAELQGSIKGLGRRWAWKETETATDVAVPEIPCGCFDGD